MKKKKLLEIPPIPLRGGRKNYYRMAADVVEICGENHLVCDVYERDIDGEKYEYKMRAAYTAHDWALYFPSSGEWSRASIENTYSVPVYDDCGRLQGPGIPKYAGWKNTALDAESRDCIVSFCKPYVTGYRIEGWNDYLTGLECAVRREKQKKEAEGRKKRLSQRMEDMPDIPENFGAWADQTLYHGREFVFYKRKGRWAECTCSRCGGQYKILTRRSETFEGQFEDVHPVPKNGMATACLHCGAEASYKPIGRCKNDYGIIHTAYLLQPFRGDGAVVRYFNIHKEWSTTKPSRVFWIELARAYFDKGRTRTDWKLHNNMAGRDEWCDHNIGGMSNLSMKPGKIYMGNVDEWKRSRVLRYSGLREYMEIKDDVLRPVWYLRMAEEYPIERLVKMGLIKLADDVMESEHFRKDKTFKNMSAKRADRLLGIRPCRLSLLREMEGDVTLFRILQAERENTEGAMAGDCTGKGAWTDEQVVKLFNLKIEKAPLMKALEYMSVTKFLNRVEKYCGGAIPDRIEGWECSRQAQAYSETAKLYLDYIRLRTENGYGMERSTDQAPKDLKKAHRDIVQAINAAENERRLEESEKTFSKIKKRYRALKRQYAWKHDDLMIRPAKSVREIIEEGQILHHCVGRGDYYIRKHNDGESFILFVRYANNPNEPYITLEVDPAKNKILQWYGRNDTKPNEAKIEEWLGKWLAEVKERKSQEALSAAKAQANQEAAAEQVLVAAV